MTAPRDFEELLGEIACLESIPHDALDAFIEMLRVNFPSALDEEV